MPELLPRPEGKSVAGLPDVLQFDFVNPDLICDARQAGARLHRHAIERVSRMDGRLEPFRFQVQPKLGPVTGQQRAVFEEKEWNLNLHPVLQAA